MSNYANYSLDKPVLSNYKPRESEKKILDFWAEWDAKPRPDDYWHEKNKGTISFAWGPPFPTGSPHSGHVFNAILKDVYLRFGHQKYLEVKSRFYWDCHGLPVEHEVDRKLGIMCPDDIHKMGISVYNEECRKFLLRHETDWKNIFKQIGARVDLTETCSAMTVQSMERVWDAFKQLYDKGRVYRGTKVLPYSTGCFTHLSDLEAEQNSKHVTELGAMIALDVVKSAEKLLIWTVGPWKLVGAEAICVNPNARYVKVKMVSSGTIYIVSKSRLRYTFPTASEYTPLVVFEGTVLKDLHCHSPYERTKQFRVLTDASILDDVGTGIVALSPYFDEDDYRICNENEIQFDEHLCPVDDAGRLKECVPEFGGLSISEASTAIVESLQRLGCLFYIENITHKQRFCWRSNTPLIDKLVSTWFVRTKDLNEQILENSAKVNWIFSDGHDILKNSTKKFNDWAVGRSRYWGTPIPIWSSPSGDEVVCVGGIKELLELTGLPTISDLHREFVDDLQIQSKVPGNPPLRRVPDVFDCWFEASVFAREDEDPQVDCMIEGSDQYFGWFYTTTALSTALDLPPPSKNVLVHGLIQTFKGEKISKRRHNHNDPLHIVEKYGADALRLYLLTTPLVTGGNFILREQDVPQMASRILPLLYEILKDLLPRFGKSGCVSYGVAISLEYMPNVFDKWILSRTERLIQFYDAEMTAFRPQTVIAEIMKHLEAILGVYMPIRRGNFKEKHNENVNYVLYGVMFKFMVMLSPFAPFFTEHIYQIIKPWVSYYKRELMYKVPLLQKSGALIVEDVEQKVDCWREVVELVRELRRVHIIPIQYRISELILISPTTISFKDDEVLNEVLLDVVNVHKVSFTNERSKYGVELEADLRVSSSLHQNRSPAEIETIASNLQQLTDEEVEALIRNNFFTINEEDVPLEEVQILWKLTKALDKNQAISCQNDIAVIIRMNKELDYYEEGTRLELVNSLIKFRKKCKVYPSEEATVYYSTKDKCMRHAFKKYLDSLNESTNSIVKCLDDGTKCKEGTIQMEVEIKGVPVELSLYKEPV